MKDLMWFFQGWDKKQVLALAYIGICFLVWVLGMFIIFS